MFPPPEEVPEEDVNPNQDDDSMVLAEPETPPEQEPRAPEGSTDTTEDQGGQGGQGGEAAPQHETAPGENPGGEGMAPDGEVHTLRGPGQTMAGAEQGGAQSSTPSSSSASSSSASPTPAPQGRVGSAVETEPAPE